MKNIFFNQANSRELFSVVSAVLGCSLTTAVNAAVLEEIVVTAQKREQNMQDVGISVSAFSGKQMDALGVTNTTEIVQQIPSLSINAFSPNITTFNIRGVSQANFQDNLEAPIAVFVDDAYVSSMNAISGQLFDIQRVEVLRGPQGTLFGRNATGGLIHYVSRAADEQKLNGYIKAEIGNYNSKNLELAIGGSLTDNVRGRFSARIEEADGYIEATQSGVDDLNGKDSYALRGTLQVDFNDNLTGDFWLKYSKTDKLPTGGFVNVALAPDASGLFPVNAVGLSLGGGTTSTPWKHNSGTSGFLDRENTSVIAKFNWDMSEYVKVVAITSYMVMDKSYLEDGDGSPDPSFPLDFLSETDFTQFTQEIRFSGELDSMRWQTGFYYMDAEIDNDAVTTGPPLVNVFAPVVFSGGLDVYGIGLMPGPAGVSSHAGIAENPVVESKNWSVFGQAEFDITDDLTLIVGLRWSEDDKEIDYTSRLFDPGTGPIAFDTFFAPPGPPVFYAGTPFDIQSLSAKDDIDYGDWAGRLQLDWRVTDETLLFASWNRGIKGGNWSALYTTHINHPANSPGTVSYQHPEEVLNSFELGIKTELSDWGRLNANLFYYDYEDYQAFSTAGLVAQVQSSDATNQGAEVELFLTPGDHWDIVLGLSLLDSEVDEVTGPPTAGGPAASLKNVEFPSAPGFSFNYLFRYNWDTLGGNVALQVDGIYEDDQFLEIQNGPASEQEKGGFINARASYTSGDGAWELTVWIKNIEDQDRKAYSLDLGQIGGSTAVFQPPQTFGVNVKYNFGN